MKNYGISSKAKILSTAKTDSENSNLDKAERDAEAIRKSKRKSKSKSKSWKDEDSDDNNDDDNIPNDEDVDQISRSSDAIPSKPSMMSRLSTRFTAETDTSGPDDDEGRPSRSSRFGGVTRDSQLGEPPAPSAVSEPPKSNSAPTPPRSIKNSLGGFLGGSRSSVKAEAPTPERKYREREREMEKPKEKVKERETGFKMPEKPKKVKTRADDVPPSVPASEPPRLSQVEQDDMASSAFDADFDDDFDADFGDFGGALRLCRTFREIPCLRHQLPLCLASHRPHCPATALPCSQHRGASSVPRPTRWLWRR